MMFDTSIVIDMLKGKSAFRNGSISVMTLMEVCRGLENEEKLARVLTLLEETFNVLYINYELVLVYSSLYQKLKKAGLLLSDVDLIIASTAIANKEKLVTKDSDFVRIGKFLDVEIEK